MGSMELYTVYERRHEDSLAFLFTENTADFIRRELKSIYSLSIREVYDMLGGRHIQGYTVG
nr:MAG TPA: hypothetical protein [Caudoviricetes sp.]